MTLAQLINRAEREAPVHQVGLRRIAETRSRRIDAELAVRNNPTLSVESGPRVTDADVGPRVSAGITQLFDLGGGAGARTRAVDAAVDRETALAENDLRLLRADVERSYWRLLWVKERTALSEELEGNAARALALAEKRKIAGDAVTLDVNIARAALARARSQTQKLAADRASALSGLVVLLGAEPDEDFELVGDLRRMPIFDADQAQAPRRADVRAAEHEVIEADADADLAEALAIPQLGVGVRYELEEPEVHAFIGTLSLTLPVFAHAQGLSAEAAAKRQRAVGEGLSLSRTARAEVVGAMKTFASRVEATRELEVIGAETRDENVGLAERAFEAGESSLSELLAAQRELAFARAEYLDSLLEAQLAAVDVREASGTR